MMITSPSTCIEAEKEQVAKVILMPGDPLRAKYIAEKYLEDAVCFNTVRNMLGFTGTYKGKRISVMGHGMGIPSAVLYVHELFNCFDVETVIRIGTAGALPEELHARDLVLAVSAATNSNLPSFYGFPGTLCPTADASLLRAGAAVCREHGYSYRMGTVFTTDVFYDPNPDTLELARKYGMLCVDMETAGIYLEAMASKKKALSILSISNHLFRSEELTVLERQESFNEMMEAALDTAVLYA